MSDIFDFGDPWQHRDPLTPLAAKRLNDREQMVADAINGLGSDLAGSTNIWLNRPRLRGYVNMLDSDYALPTTDGTSVINAVMAALPAGTEVYFPAQGPGGQGFYDVRGLVAPPIGKALRVIGDGPGATVWSRPTNSSDFLHMGGSKTTVASAGGLLTVDAPAGALTITIANASSLTVGQYLNLRSNRVYSADSVINRYGENVRVWSKAGNVVTLDGPLKLDYAVADGAIADVINSITPVVEGITFRGVKATGTSGGLVFSYALNSWVNDCEMDGLDSSSYTPLACIGGGATRLYMHDGVNDGPSNRFAYGVNCGGASTGMTFRDLNSDRIRHTFTTNGDGTGIPQSNYVEGGVAYNPTAAAWDTHQSSRDIHFRGQKVVGAALAEDGVSKGQAAQLRSVDSSIDGLVQTSPNPTLGTPGIGVTVEAARAVIKNANLKTAGAVNGIGIDAPDCHVENCTVDSDTTGIAPLVITGDRCTAVGGLYKNPRSAAPQACVKIAGGSGHVIDVTGENSLYGAYVSVGANASSIHVRGRNVTHPVHGDRVPYQWTNQAVLVATLDVPMNVAAAPVVGGGTFAAGTYFYKVTAINGAGETLPSAEISATVALNGQVVLTWLAPPQAGTTGYKVYRATSAGAENVSPALVATLGNVLTYTDTGTAAGAGNVPAANTATLTSPLVWTNPFPGSGQLVIFGGTVTAVTHKRSGQSQSLVSSGAHVAQVGIGDSIQINYTVAPTVAFIPDVT